MKKKFFSTLLFIILSSSLTFGQSKEENVRTLMIKTGVTDMMKQVMNQMIDLQKQNNREVPDEFWDSFMAELDTDELLNMMIPIYSKHYTDEDILALIEFYNSPVGQKTIQVQPAIMQESMTAGQVWGMKLAEKVVAEMQKKGY